MPCFWWLTPCIHLLPCIRRPKVGVWYAKITSNRPFSRSACLGKGPFFENLGKGMGIRDWEVEITLTPTDNSYSLLPPRTQGWLPAGDSPLPGGICHTQGSTSRLQIFSSHLYILLLDQTSGRAVLLKSLGAVLVPTSVAMSPLTKNMKNLGKSSASPSSPSPL